MGTQDSGQNHSTEPAKMPPDDHSEVWHYGRRLRLEFVGEDVPVLHRIEFKPRQDADPDFREQDSKEDFSWSDVPKGISIVILKYLLWDKQGRKGSAYLTGKHRDSLAASLGDAITNETGFVEVFGEVLPSGITTPRVKQIFVGENIHGKARDNRDRRIRVQESYLPPDCITVYWDARGPKPLFEKKDFELLLERLGKAAGITAEPKPVEGEASQAEPSTPATPPESPKDETFPNQKKAPQSATELLQEPKPAPQAQDESKSFLKWMIREFSQTFSTLRDVAKAKEAPATPTAPAPESPKAAPAKQSEAAKPDKKPESEQPAKNAKAATNPLTIPRPEHPPLPPIPKELFSVPPTNGCWPDDMPLIEFPDGDTRYDWTLKNSFEGVLVTGRTGSGKTSGSGVTFAESFLRSAFGGLILTVKEDEAEHWRRLCKRCGREKDLIVVSRGGPWKFNVLAYEAQHPGRGKGLADNFTDLCKNLLRISVRSKGGGINEQIWESAGDQLLDATFELFLLAGGEISFDRLADFVAHAPTEKLPETEEDWLRLPVFGGVLLKARNSLVTDEDKRIYIKATDYWFTYYSTRPPKMRASIVLAISAMFDAFRGRDVPALISSETNVTPESIMSGKIVVLDLPLKELRHTGLMVQSAWKYSFQRALERQKRANNPNLRPVFEWDDEGQYFFSNNDHHFQDTARSSRVCRVILTQNLHSFYKEFGQGGRDAADSVFGNLNTKVFHNNSDPDTNKWAAEHLGMEIHSRVSISHNPPQQNARPQNLLDGIVNAWDPPPSAGISTTEHWEYAVQPSVFNRLRTGGKENDFMVDAYITWMGLCTEQERHFIEMSFLQNQEL